MKLSLYVPREAMEAVWRRLATFLMVATKSVGTPKAATPRSDRQRFSRIMWKSVLN